MPPPSCRLLPLPWGISGHSTGRRGLLASQARRAYFLTDEHIADPCVSIQAKRVTDKKHDMSLAKMALLPDRGVVRVAGPDAEKFLNGSITTDLQALDAQAAVHSALLTPQGKMLFEFFVTKAPEGGFLLETGKELADGLVKRLKMFMLRAKVEAENVSGAYEVAAAWGGEPPAGSDRIVERRPAPARDGARLLAPAPPGFALPPVK